MRGPVARAGLRAGADRGPHGDSAAARQSALANHGRAPRPARYAARVHRPAGAARAGAGGLRRRPPGDGLRRRPVSDLLRHHAGIRPAGGRRHLAARGRGAGLRIGAAPGRLPAPRRGERREDDAAAVRRPAGLGVDEQPPLPAAGRLDRRAVMRPVVAVTAPTGRSDAGRERVALNVAYVHALERAGLLPLVVPTILDPAHAGDALPAARGLVLTGGEDVDPARYHAAPHPKLGAIDPRRDAGELALIAAARARRMPILAICRGIQILNVGAGGTLYQDLPS